MQNFLLRVMAEAEEWAEAEAAVVPEEGVEDVVVRAAKMVSPMEVTEEMEE